MAKINEIDSSSINILGVGTAVKGDITANGDFRIDGSLIGNISAKGKLVIGTTGSVEGEITCQNADFSGNVKGKVNVAELLSLKSTSKIIGDIIINKLSIEPGAQFSGSCNMDSAKNTTLYTSKGETEKS
ncbi:MAG: polymer-forming cytoskeletal protein [Bacteroidetes bacterium]|nr:polymer-forming cytoskeletal protein [Bacteroidota bacterium]